MNKTLISADTTSKGGAEMSRRKKSIPVPDPDKQGLEYVCPSVMTLLTNPTVTFTNIFPNTREKVKNLNAIPHKACNENAPADI